MNKIIMKWNKWNEIIMNNNKEIMIILIMKNKNEK